MNLNAATLEQLMTLRGIGEARARDIICLLYTSDKELTFDAIDTVKGCLALFTGMISTMTFNKDIMEASAKNGFTNATDAADYLVNHGVPFRDAHGIVGQLVLFCIDTVSYTHLPDGTPFCKTETGSSRFPYLLG